MPAGTITTRTARRTTASSPVGCSEPGRHWRGSKRSGGPEQERSMQVMDVLTRRRPAVLPDGLPDELVLRVGGDCIRRGRPGDAHHCAVVQAAYPTLDPGQYVGIMGGRGLLR